MERLDKLRVNTEKLDSKLNTTILHDERVQTERLDVFEHREAQRTPKGRTKSCFASATNGHRWIRICELCY